MKHWNSPSVLPPVDCPLVICIGPTDGSHLELEVIRKTYLTEKNGDIEYTSIRTRQVWVGRYAWTYP